MSYAFIRKQYDYLPADPVLVSNPFRKCIYLHCNPCFFITCMAV